MAELTPPGFDNMVRPSSELNAVSPDRPLVDSFSVCLDSQIVHPP
jgi:hypothetical protein